MSAEPRAPKRTWVRALGLAALTLWVPTLVPYWIGPLTECGHCVATYSLMLPLVPGIIVPTLLGLDDALWGVVGGAVVLALLGGLTLLLRHAPVRAGAFVQTLVILLVGLEAFGFSCALRA